MKTIKIYILLFIGTLFFSACKLNDLDNYDGPNASIHGGFYDVATSELVQQDIIQGVQIEYIEEGFENPEVQYLIVKNDGTYRNNLMFAGTYTIRPVRGNFIPVAAEEIQVKGDTKVDFKVQPYIRIKDLKIEKQGNKIVAAFHLEQTVDNKVSKIALFAHREPNVGSPLNTVSSVMNIDAVTHTATEYKLEINLTENSSQLKAGSQYYFRVGALINAPEAKYNYAPAVRITI